MTKPFFFHHQQLINKQLAFTSKAIGLIIGLSLFSSSASASPSLQFGQPLPGSPAPAASEPVPQQPPSASQSTAESSPSRRSTSSSQRERPAATGNRRRRNSQSANTQPRRARTTASSQVSSLGSSTDRRSTTAQRTFRPAPSAPQNAGGWDVPQDTNGVYFSPETTNLDPPISRAANRNQSISPARSLVQPGPRTTNISAQRYTVYVLGDQLSLLDKVSQLTPSAAFTTYNQQTAVSAGYFNREIDAQARVRELSQMGLRGIVAPVAPTSTTPIPSSSSGYFGAPDGPVDPGAIFDNFDNSSSGDNAYQAHAIVNSLPIPSHGTRPPVSRKHKNRRLPQPPPTLEQQQVIAQRSTTPLPAVSPLFRQTSSQQLVPSSPSSINNLSAPTLDAGVYYLNLDPQEHSYGQTIRKLATLGVSRQQIFRTDNIFNGIVIGPFTTLSEAKQRSRQLQAHQLKTDIIHSGWGNGG